MTMPSPALPRPTPLEPPPRVGIHVDFSDGWLGGLNYFKNLVKAVAELEPRPLEFVVLTGTRADEKLIAGWPGQEVVRSPIFDRFSPPWILRKLTQKYLLSDPLLGRLAKTHRIDVISHSGYLGQGGHIPCIGWIPDFQHLHLKEVFRRWDIVRRDAEIRRIVTASTSVIVSSLSARADLLSIAPDAAAKTEVLPFVGEATPATRLVPRESLEARYGFAGDFVFLPNQYWSHKNHLTVIRALAGLKAQGRPLTVISTGKTADFRQPDFYRQVEEEIARLGVGDVYKVLGIVPYDDVVSLMHHCAFVINPSRFEGWSTTVEEAKAARKHILLSDIPVHREQAPASADFFPPTDVVALQTLLGDRWNDRHRLVTGPSEADPSTATDHPARRRRFAEEYVAIVSRALARQGAR